MFLLEVVKALHHHKVDYAIVGGFAVTMHGVVRATYDLDFVIKLDLLSFQKTEKALQEIGLEARLPVSAKEVFQFREEYIQNRNLIAWSFYDPILPMKVVDIVITEDVKNMKTVQKVIHGVKVRIASIESLIEMKKRSDRQQDFEDVKVLKTLLVGKSK